MDRVSEMNKWAREIKKVENGNVRGKNNEVSLAMIAANNHYAGFGPGTANMFRKMVGLSELSWEDQQQIQKHLQLRQQQQTEEQDQHVSNSRIVSKKQIKNRQSSLSEIKNGWSIRIIMGRSTTNTKTSAITTATTATTTKGETSSAC